MAFETNVHLILKTDTGLIKYIKSSSLGYYGSFWRRIWILASLINRNNWLLPKSCVIGVSLEYIPVFPAGVWTQQPGYRPFQRLVQPDSETDEKR